MSILLIMLRCIIAAVVADKDPSCTAPALDDDLEDISLLQMQTSSNGIWDSINNAVARSGPAPKEIDHQRNSRNQKIENLDRSLATLKRALSNVAPQMKQRQHQLDEIITQLNKTQESQIQQYRSDYNNTVVAAHNKVIRAKQAMDSAIKQV